MKELSYICDSHAMLVMLVYAYAFRRAQEYAHHLRGVAGAARTAAPAALPLSGIYRAVFAVPAGFAVDSQLAHLTGALLPAVAAAAGAAVCGLVVCSPGIGASVQPAMAALRPGWLRTERNARQELVVPGHPLHHRPAALCRHGSSPHFSLHGSTPLITRAPW